MTTDLRSRRPEAPLPPDAGAPGPRAAQVAAAMNRPGSPYVSVVIPVYKAEKILPALCRRLTDTLETMAVSYELILVCDGSPDGSWDVMAALAREYPRLVVASLARNFGQHYALAAGLDLASGEWTVVMDCDLQDEPEEIPRLIAVGETGYDVVVARRIQRQHTWWKRTTSRMFHKLFAFLSGLRLDSSVGSFRVLRKPARDALCSMRESYRMFAGLVDWLGFETGYVDVKHAARYEGESSYDLGRLVRLALDGMISFSNRPLYLSIGIGILISVASGLYGSFLLIRGLVFGVPDAIPGWLSTITATSFIGGLILLNQGVLGIYLGRLYNQAKGRPLYVVDKIIVGQDLAAADTHGDIDE
jgi:dolichol-phosphate mannosyltransferase